MSAGFVYVMTNPCLSIIKVGCSTKVPTFRAEELSQVTGVPDAFEVVYYAHFNEMFKAEKEAHYQLRHWHYKKEFFSCSPQNAISILENMGGIRCHLSVPLGFEYVICPTCNKSNRRAQGRKGGNCGSCHSPLEIKEPDQNKPRKAKFPFAIFSPRFIHWFLLRRS
ncbi:MAG: GIY-YIG nuclease family protein [Pseudomonadota bacterium]|nr:GIY-YIG nuclease family protein [Pseudomonadota bacterium]